MAGNSFAFKGWAITLAGGLAAFAAVEEEVALFVIAIGTTALFWALDGYYLWLERGFIALHKAAAKLESGEAVSFNMAVDQKQALRSWLRTCLRPHLCVFYGVIITTSVLAILFFTEDSDGSTFLFQFQVR